MYDEYEPTSGTKNPCYPPNLYPSSKIFLGY